MSGLNQPNRSLSLLTLRHLRHFIVFKNHDTIKHDATDAETRNADTFSFNSWL